MKIDTNSWHYKLNNYVYGSEMPKNLCPYFWGTVLSVTFLGWAMWGIVKIAEAIDRQHWSMPSFNIGFLKYLERHSKFLVYGLYGGMALWGGTSYFVFGNPGGLMLLGVAGGGTFYFTFRDKFVSYKPKKIYIPPQKKNPNLFVEMVKAKHHSMCPRLDFVDKTKEEFNESVKKIDEKPNWETPRKTIKQIKEKFDESYSNDLKATD